MGKTPLLADEPKGDEPPPAGTEENLKVIYCDWNHEEHTDEENLKQLFYTLQSRPDIKKALLEEFFNRIKPWVDYLEQRRRTITSS